MKEEEKKERERGIIETSQWSFIDNDNNNNNNNEDDDNGNINENNNENFVMTRSFKSNDYFIQDTGLYRTYINLYFCNCYIYITIIYI